MEKLCRIVSQHISSFHLTTEAALVVDVFNDLGAVVAVLLLVISNAHLVRRPDVYHSFEQKLTNVSEKLAHQ